MKEKLKSIVFFFLNPRLLLCFGLAWIITNGWSYVFFTLGTWLDIPWMAAVGRAYLTFLWLPISPEKLVTVAIAIALLRFLFPKDQKTLAVLIHMRDRLREAIRKRKAKKAGTGDATSEEEDIPKAS